jgi:CrcB protein
MLAYVAVGGLIGTVSRYLLAGWVQGRFGNTGFPSGTLAVNILGSLLLGFLLRYALGTTVVSPELRAGLTIGFCGAFTTMSTFSYETLTLLEGGDYSRAALYMTGSMFGCVLAVLAGTTLASKLL